MCGIIGFNFEDKSLLKKGMDILQHRGPDDSGYDTDKNVSLGHRRLSIIDLSKKGHQPMQYNDLTIIYNGEIYNFKEIREELIKKKHRFISSSDTEVILHAYEEYGENCLHKFNGMFAFCIYDSKKNLLFLARDRLGIKPLYYYFKDGKFIFASEIKAILEDKSVKREINYKALSEYFEYSFTINDETIFKNINKVLPGYYMIFDLKSNNLEISRYWKIKENTQDGSLDYYSKLLRKHLEESIKLRLVSDVPLGATLSGGLDSSAVVGLMSQFADVKTFTVGFEEGYNEFEYARLVADKFKTDHKEILVDFKNITNIIPKVVWHMDTIVNKNGILSAFFLYKALKKKITVTLIGDGSDEVFGGYPRHRLFSPYRLDFKEVFNLRKRGLYYSHFTLLRALNKTTRLKKTNLPLFNDNERKKIFKHTSTPLWKVLEEYMKDSKRDNELNKFLIFELEKELDGLQLMRVDKMTMANSIEARVPFLDYRLVEFSTAIPSKFKMHGYDAKYILKKSMNDVLPKEILQREKMGLRTPLDEWFENDFLEIVPNILQDVGDVGISQGYVDKILSNIKPRVDFKGYRYKRNLSQLWFLSMLNIWYKMFIKDERKMDINHYI